MPPSSCHPLRCFASACRRIASMRQFCFDREVTSPEAVEKKLLEVYPTQRLRGPKKLQMLRKETLTRNRDRVRTFRLECLGPLLRTQKQHKLKTQSSLAKPYRFHVFTLLLSILLVLSCTKSNGYRRKQSMQGHPASFAASWSCGSPRTTDATGPTTRAFAATWARFRKKAWKSAFCGQASDS